MRTWSLPLLAFYLQGALWCATDGLLHLRAVSAQNGASIDDARLSIRILGGPEVVKDAAVKDFSLPAGIYEVTAKSRTWNGARITVEIGSGETWATITLDLPPPITCWPPSVSGVTQPRRLSLKILDGGKPESGAWIKVISALGRELREAVTGQDGVVEFESLPNGPYLVIRESLPPVTRWLSHNSVCTTSAEVDFSTGQ